MQREDGESGRRGGDREVDNGLELMIMSSLQVLVGEVEVEVKDVGHNLHNLHSSACGPEGFGLCVSVLSRWGSSRAAAMYNLHRQQCK